MNAQTATRTDDPQWQYEQFKLGWDLYTGRYPLNTCRNDQQWRGWWAALNADAVASLPATSANHLGF